MKITELAIRRPAFITMIFCALAVLGIYSYTQMGSDLLPKISFPMVFIAIPYPGAGPQEVESQVSKPVEEALSSLSGMKSLRTYSMENFSFTWIEFVMSANADVVLNDVERKVNEIRLSFPDKVKQPQISKADINDSPILRIAAVSKVPDRDFYQLIKDRIIPRIEQIPGVGTVKMVGGREREIRIEVDNERLKAYNLSILQISQKLATENIDFPAGKIEQPTRRSIIRVAGALKSLEAVQSVVVAATPTGPVYLKDVAAVIDTTKENYTLSRLNGQSCIGLIVQKSSDANALACGVRVQKLLKTLEQEHAQKGLSFSIAQNITNFTRFTLNEVKKEMALAICMVALVLFLFLRSGRNSFIVLLSIPVSIVTAISVMHFFGLTINMVTLMALTLVIGILVDDSIVVLENIHRHLEMGEEPRSAALKGRSEIGFAAIAITLVDVVVFLPMTMLSGLVGKVFKEFGITIVATTLVSLFVSFTLTPLLASRWARIVRYDPGSRTGRLVAGLETSQSWLNGYYRRILTWALRHKLTVLAGCFALLVGAITLIPLGLIGTEFMPNLDRGEFALTFEMPKGTSMAKTGEAALTIERMVRELEDIDQYYMMVGRQEGAFGDDELPNIGQVQVKLKRNGSKHTTRENITELLRKTSVIPGCETKAALIGLFGAAEATPIEIEVKGEELDPLIAASERIRGIVAATPGTRDIRSTWEEGQPELRVVVDREKCALHGIGLEDVAYTLRNSFEGEITSRYRDGATEYDIRVILAAGQRSDPAGIGELGIVSRYGQRVRLDQISSIANGSGPTEIARKDRSRVITLLSNLDGTRPLGDVTKDIDKSIQKLGLPSDIRVYFGGDVENMQDMLSDMAMAVCFAVLFVYMIMVSLFESYLYPFIIMFSIPVALVGGLSALAITGENIGFLSLIGILMSIGLVTKNAILLVDYTNTLRSRGMHFLEALKTAGPIRLRPILMTTMTMVCGMLPLALATGPGASFRKGLAWVVIGSLLSSMFLTLVLIPVMYAIMENLKEKVHGSTPKERAIM
jgi:HAE1 family hydrophobic/amphiphilic exporter-1